MPKSLRLPEGIILGKFKPFARVMKEMDMLELLTVDCSYRNERLGNLHLELERHPYKKKIVDIRIVSYRKLMEEKSVRSSMRALARAFFTDWQTRTGWNEVTMAIFLCAYAAALRLILLHPQTWKIKA